MLDINKNVFINESSLKNKKIMLDKYKALLPTIRSYKF